MKEITLVELYELYLKNQFISKDSRNIQPNSIYFALKGDNFNGNLFAEEALKKGAAYAIVDEQISSEDPRVFKVNDGLKTLQELAKLHRSKLNIPIIGITGSNGKTTTKELIAAVLEKEYKTYYTKGNLNNHIGVPLSILEIKEFHQIAVIEMGANHQGEIAFLSTISDPDYGIITNIGKAHLEGFGGIEGVKKGKSELYKHLEKKQGKLFINGDDEVLLDLAPDLEQFKYGTNTGLFCEAHLERSQPTIKGSWKCDEQNGKIEAQIYGEYNFYNMLAAICIGNYFNVSSPNIDAAIREYDSTDNRSQLIKREDYTLLLDAYNANPSSMQKAIENFSARKADAKVVILGDMFELGEDSAEEHKKIIELTENQNFSLSVFVGSHFFKQKKSSKKLLFFEQSKEAKNWFDQFQKSKHEILIKGSRGMALERIV
ncbi:MAG: UDP-N-acetylmuramoyl-tripeptide--D-alanyl-D-alanine ligase [Vicingaceae bacterium]